MYTSASEAVKIVIKLYGPEPFCYTFCRARACTSKGITVRKVLDTLHKLTGIKSFKRALNPVTYVDHAAFAVVRQRSNHRVLSGVFRGIYLEYSSGGSEYRPKFVGTYESELNEALRAVPGGKQDIIVDLGADDGYYSIGLARLKPGARVVAVECESMRVARLQRNIKRNRAGRRVQVCNLRVEQGNALQQLLEQAGQAVLIKCDIEGAEYKVLDEATLCALARSETYLLVETHGSENLEAHLLRDMRSAGYSVEIINRHDRKHIPRLESDRVSSLLCRIFARRWTDENRPAFNRWVFARPTVPNRSIMHPGIPRR